MTAFCTVQQYEARYGSAKDTGMLQECLNDCTAVIKAKLDRAGLSYDEPGEDYADRLMRVCRSMANRVMPNNSPALPGVTQASIGAGGFTQSFSFATTYGTPKMLDSEKELLGVGVGGIGFFRMG